MFIFWDIVGQEKQLEQDKNYKNISLFIPYFISQLVISVQCIYFINQFSYVRSLYTIVNIIFVM